MSYGGYLLVAGIDLCSDTYIRLALLDSRATHCSFTEDLHRYRDLGAFGRWWTRRLDSAPLVAAILGGADLALEQWLEDRSIAAHRVHQCQVHPFLREARELEVPRRYRHAHALAKCVATRLTAGSRLQHLEARFQELTSLLRDAHADLQRLNAATRLCH